MPDEAPITEESMSEETGNQSALRILQGQVESLTSQLLAASHERDEYQIALNDVSTERDTLKTAPDAASRIAELEAALRDRNHFDKFAELAGAAKAKAKALRQLWREAKASGYDPDSDEVDEKALQTVVATLKTQVDYAFDSDGVEPTKTAQEATRPTSRTKYGLDVNGPITPGGGRSPERNQGADGTIVTQEMRADPKFMLDPKNKELIRDAAIGGRFR